MQGVGSICMVGMNLVRSSKSTGANTPGLDRFSLLKMRNRGNRRLKNGAQQHETQRCAPKDTVRGGSRDTSATRGYSVSHTFSGVAVA